MEMMPKFGPQGMPAKSDEETEYYRECEWHPLCEKHNPNVDHSRDRAAVRAVTAGVDGLAAPATRPITEDNEVKQFLNMLNIVHEPARRKMALDDMVK